MRVRAGQDFATGIMFALIGAAALYIGADYPMGIPQRPGTGVLPRILAWCLVITGFVLVLQSLVLDMSVVRRALPTLLGSVGLGAVMFFGGPAVGINEAWCVLPVLVGFIAVMEILIPGTAWRQLAAVTLATVAFGMTVDELGLVVAMVLSLTICALGTAETQWREYIVFLAIMLALGVGTFIWLLGMPIPIWPVKVPGWLPFLQH
ncbi:MAG: hypothetical protein AB7L90_09735 [Hyphomicrobiaceae bacterium]